MRTPGYGWVIGSTSEYALASCAPRGIGPFSEAAVTMGAKTWRVEANAAGSGGDSEQGAGALSEAYAVDTYTVLKGTSGLPDNAEVPLFIRLHLAADVQNTGPGTYPGYPSAYVQVDPFLQRYVPAGLTTFHGGEFRFTITEEKYMDIPLRSVTFGTRFRAFWALTAFAESGIGADPKVAEASVEFSLCSSAPGVQVIGASGTDGDCGGDLSVTFAEPVQSVFGVSTLIAGKDAVVAVDLRNDYDRPIEANVRFDVQRTGLPTEDFTEQVTVPANCPSKRYYFPSPDPTFADLCGVASEALGSLAFVPPGVEPVAGSDWAVSVTASPVDALIDTASLPNNSVTNSYLVQKTKLDIAYGQVACGFCEQPNADPFDIVESKQRNDAHTLGMYPLSRSGFQSDACVEPDGSLCGVASSGLCGDPCVLQDLENLFGEVKSSYPLILRAVGFVPPEYFGLQLAAPPGAFITGVAGSESVFLDPRFSAGMVLSSGHSGHDPTLPHELLHTLLPRFFRNQHLPQTPVGGVWVGCRSLGLSSCVVPESDPSNLDTYNLMLDNTPKEFKPPQIWIEDQTYADLSTVLSAGVDPRVLLLTGSWSTSGEITIRTAFELPEASTSRELGGRDEWVIESLDGEGRVVGSHRFEPQFVLSVRSDPPLPEQRLDAASIMFTLPYPLETTALRFRRGETIDAVLDPLSETLRFTILKIPLAAYERDGEQRQAVLLSKVEVIEKDIASGNLQGALQKLRHDLKDKVEKWVIEYPANTFNKSFVLNQIEFAAMRLEARIAASADERKEKPEK